MELHRALRRLVRAPAFSLTVVLSVGIGVGMATAVASLLEATLSARVPYAEPDALVELLPTAKPGSEQPNDFGLDTETVLALMEADARSFHSIGAEGIRVRSTWRSGSETAQVEVRPVFGDWFGTLGTPAERGRVLLEREVQGGAAPAAVVSASFWRKQLAGAPSAIGASLELAGRLFTVVGVMPPAFDRTESIWIPWDPDWESLEPSAFRVVGRLRDGLAPADAASELSALAMRLHAEGRVRGDGGLTVQSVGANADSSGAARLWVLAALTGLVLLVGLGNLTSLFLSRAERRKGHLAVSISLGASAWQIREPFLLEGLLLGLAGAGIGVTLAPWLRDAAAWVAADAIPADLGVDAGPTLVGVSVAIVATMLLSLVALRRVDPAGTSTLLSSGAHTSTGGRSERAARHALVAAQVTGCIVLTVTVTTLGFAYRSFVAPDLGYDAEGWAQAVLDYRTLGLGRADETAWAEAFAERLNIRSDIDRVALLRMNTMRYPPRREDFLVVDRPSGDPVSQPRTSEFFEVDHGFFEGLGISVVQGRGFTAAEHARSAAVVIVNERAATEWWPSADPIGRQVRLGAAGRWLTVVGVVDARDAPSGLARMRHAAGTNAIPLLFRPLSSGTIRPEGWDRELCSLVAGGCGVNVFAKGRTGSVGATRAIREELAASGVEVPLRRVGPLVDLQMGPLGSELRLYRAWAGVAVAFALALAILGVMGVVIENLVRQVREIGIRMALGASPIRILAAVLRQTVLAALAGVAAGMVALVWVQAALSRTSSYRTLISNWHVAPGVLHPIVIGTSLTVVLVAVLSAATLVAIRALRIDPAVAFRVE